MSGSGWSVVTGKPRNAGAGNRSEDAGGEVELADAVVVSVGEVEMVGCVQRKTLRGVERSGDGGAIVAREALHAIAGDGGDEAGDGVDAADAVVRRLGKVEIAGGVKGDGRREEERGGHCGAGGLRDGHARNGEQKQKRDREWSAVAPR